MSDDLKSWHAESWHAGYHCRDHQVADLERMLRAEQSALTEQHAANARLQAERDALAEQLNSVTSMAERFGQERDALRADAERLDWLANFLADVIIGDADPCLHFIAADGNDQRNSWPQVWRRAIDAARKEGEG